MKSVNLGKRIFAIMLVFAFVTAFSYTVSSTTWYNQPNPRSDSTTASNVSPESLSAPKANIPQVSTQSMSMTPSSFSYGNYYTHWWVGSIYPLSSVAELGKTIYASITIPNSYPRSDETFYVLLSVFDTAGSYDQIGVYATGGGWLLAWSWSEGGTINPDYHPHTAGSLSLGATYTFYITAILGVIRFSAYQGSTLVWSQDETTGGLFLHIANNYLLIHCYTCYEEVIYTSTEGGSPEFDFYFTNNYWVSVDDVAHATTWNTFYLSDWPDYSVPANVVSQISGNSVFVHNPTAPSLLEISGSTPNHVRTSGTAYSTITITSHYPTQNDFNLYVSSPDLPGANSASISASNFQNAYPVYPYSAPPYGQTNGQMGFSAFVALQGGSITYSFSVDFTGATYVATYHIKWEIDGMELTSVVSIGTTDVIIDIPDPPSVSISSPPDQYGYTTSTSGIWITAWVHATSPDPNFPVTSVQVACDGSYGGATYNGGDYWYRSVYATSNSPWKPHTITATATSAGGTSYSNTITIYVLYLAPPGDHGCPNLLVWNGSAFVDEGLLSIHNLVNPDSDVVLQHTLSTIPALTHHNLYTLELYERPEGYTVSHSWLNQAMLYAVDTNGIWHKCNLVSATHSRDGNVLPQLLRNDSKWAETYFGDKIVLQFTAPHIPNIDHFVFVIVGHNMK